LWSPAVVITTADDHKAEYNATRIRALAPRSRPLFDLGYNPLGKISERRLVDFPALWGYARDLYQMPAFRDTTDFSAFAEFGSGPAPSFFNDAPWRIQVDPHRADWDEPHGRDHLG
jgi:glutathionyl-hydroquinone reductase